MRKESFDIVVHLKSKTISDFLRTDKGTQLLQSLETIPGFKKSYKTKFKDREVLWLEFHGKVPQGRSHPLMLFDVVDSLGEKGYMERKERIEKEYHLYFVGAECSEGKLCIN
ncbi:hypothetical protein E5D57_012508 [Metarhizium anisopliae]|nr:hypothetical protein E5D57_012508 [Metarhizium anisopliae]